MRVYQWSRSARFWSVVHKKRCPTCKAKKGQPCIDMRIKPSHHPEHFELWGSRVHVERIGRKLGRTAQVF